MDCTPQILGPALSGAFISGLGSDTECPHGKGQVKDREDWLCCHLGGSHCGGELAQQKPHQVSQKEIHLQTNEDL